MELKDLTNEQKCKLFDTLITQAKTMSKGEALNIGNHTEKDYLIAQLTSLCFLDTVKAGINCKMYE